ncbi:MAG: threonylcarbamoyl-AMP synthase [Muribaculaceae bacterium]|nr:threonylcarbamoyl-AMP synthase [Muribaculaceae bacterium]
MNLTEAQVSDIAEATRVLREGGVILYPTDTVWGIGCDARNSRAVRRIFEIKRRSEAKALITLVDSPAALERVVDDVPEVAAQLAELSDSPVTIIYDHGRGVAPELLAADGSIGVRLTREPFSAALCRSLRGPLVSTSANVSGEPTPMDFASISPEILAAVDYVCTSRRDEAPAAKSSSVIKISAGGLFKILRK